MARPREKHPKPAEVIIGDLLIGASRIQALYVAVHLGIPDLLANGPRSSTLLASTTGVHPEALHRLLRFLVVEGYFALGEDGRFCLTPLAEPLLSTSDSGVRAGLIGTATRGWKVWGNLLHSIETGQPAFDRVFGEPYFAEQWRNADQVRQFDAFLAAGSEATGRALAKSLEPAACIADLGCGSGGLLVALLQAWPKARGIAFDAPQPLELAAARFASAGFHDRVECVPGDFFETVPPGADLYVFSLVLHDWDDARCLQILRNCQGAMAPGARLVIVEKLMPDDPREAPSAVHGDLGMLVMTGGRERTLAEYRSLLERAGLRFDRATALPVDRQTTAIQASRGLV